MPFPTGPYPCVEAPVLVFLLAVHVLVPAVYLQAFLEFAEQPAAENMVSYYSTNPAQIRLKACYVQFSNHKELKTNNAYVIQVVC